MIMDDLKITDVMVGDYIEAFEVRRVINSIHKKALPGDIDYISTILPGREFPHTNLSFRICYAHPVQLSEEWLKRRGWKNVGDEESPIMQVEQDGQIFNWERERGRCECSQMVNENGQEREEVCFSCLYVSYVHELQHALRFCGMDSIADSMIRK